MALIQHSRILTKRSTVGGVVPTIPASNDHTDGTWQDTDIYKGEIFFNLADDRMWTRFDSGIFDLLSAANISDAAYGISWDGVTGVAPSKNAVYDKIETLLPLDGSKDMTGNVNFIDNNEGVTWSVSSIKENFGTLTFVASDILVSSTSTFSAAATFNGLLQALSGVQVYGAGGVTFYNSPFLLATIRLDLDNLLLSAVQDINIDAGGNINLLSPVVLDNQSSDPTGSEGMLYYNTVSDRFKGYENSQWKNIITTYNEAFTALTNPGVASTWTVTTVTGAPVNSWVDILMTASTARNLGARAVGSGLARVINTTGTTIRVKTNSAGQVELFTSSLVGTNTFTLIGHIS